MLKRHDFATPAPVPALGKPETSYPTPNITSGDRVVIERVPIKPNKYRPLPYHAPHPSYDTTGLFLVWQGKVKAANNQVVALRVYANDTIENEDWFNASIRHAGDVSPTFPVYTRSYVELRESYQALVPGSKLQRVVRLKVLTGGTYAGTGTPTVTVTAVGGGTAPTANAIMNPGKTAVIALELLTPGANLVANPTIAFSGGGQTVAATATAEIQNFTTALLVKEETTKLDSEDQQLASLFIKVHRVYETLPGPKLVWDEYRDERGSIQRTTQSVLASDVTGGIGSEAATFARTGSVPAITVTKTWFEPRGDSAVVLTKFVETWIEVIVQDYLVTSDFGGGILSHRETTAEPNTQSVETGLLIVSSRLSTKSPHEQTLITEKLDPSSAVPVLELLTGGAGYPTAPTPIFSGGTCGTGPVATSVLGFGLASIAVNAGGSNFFAPPAVGIGGVIGGGGFAISVLGFGLDTILLDDGGSLYATPPTVGITGDGSGATGTAVLGFGVYYATVTNPGGRAIGTLTSDNTNVANNDTVTIGTKVYTFKTALTPTEGEVLRGASADASLLNLVRAINHTGTPGTDYSCAAAHPRVFAAAAVTAHAFAVTSIQPGTVGNAIVTTETSTHLSWSAATLTGGFAYTEIPQAILTGDGTGAFANVIMGNPVGSITMNNKGVSYETPPDVIEVGLITGQGLVATSVLAFALASITVNTAGSYASVPTVTIGPPETGGVQATAEVVLSYGVDSILVTNGGSAYTGPPTVGFGAGSGTGAAGTAVLGFAVASATIDDPGTAYTSFPSFTFTGGGGTGATINIRMGLLTATIASAGTGYSVDDILDIVGGTHTTVGQLHVTTVGGGGEVTGVTIETAGVYSAISSNPRTTIGGGGGVTTETLTYVSDGDTNGAFYRLGTNFGAIAWTNPHTAGRCTFIKSSSLTGADEATFCNRATDYNTTDNFANEWVVVDVGPNRDMIMSDYLIQNGAADGLNAPGNWEMQGSNNVATNDIAGVNAATWAVIDSRSSDTTIAQTVGSWGRFVLGSTPAAYRWFRIYATGTNQAGLFFLQISEVELYGDLDYILTGTGATFNLTYQLVQVNVTASGSLYTTAPVIAIAAGGGTTALAHVTLATAGSVKSVTITAPGTDYTAPFALSFTSGGGAGAAATATPGGAGIIDHFVFTEPGRGYINNPPVSLSGAGGGVATAVLATSGEVWRVDVIIGGVYEAAPTLLLSGGGGTDATATANLDVSTLFVQSVHIFASGDDYTTPPVFSFRYADGTIPTDLAASATLLSTGHVKSVTLTAPGTLYTYATIGFSGGGGSGAAATATLATIGSVKSVTVTTPGLYRTTPSISFIGGGGSGATGTATLASTGSVVALTLVIPGNCTVAPTVSLPGGTTAATALYHIGTDEWPVLPGYETDASTGIVVDILKQVKATGIPHPGRAAQCLGRYIDAKPIDIWKTIYITSKVNLDTLPCPETFPLRHGLHIPPRLESIEVVWTVGVSKLVEALASKSHARVSSGSNSDIIIRSSEGFHGDVAGFGIREWFFGPPPLAYSLSFNPLNFRGVSGSAVVAATSSATGSTQTSDGGIAFDDSFQSQVHAVDIRDHLVGRYNVISTEIRNGVPTQISNQPVTGGNDAFVLHRSQAVNALAAGPGGTVAIAAYGTPATMKVSIPRSTPTTLPSTGSQLLADLYVEKWRFDVWNIVRAYVQMPEL